MSGDTKLKFQTEIAIFPHSSYDLERLVDLQQRTMAFHFRVQCLGTQPWNSTALEKKLCLTLLLGSDLCVVRTWYPGVNLQLIDTRQANQTEFWILDTPPDKSYTGGEVLQIAPTPKHQKTNKKKSGAW